MQAQMAQMAAQIQQLQPMADDNQAKLELKKMDLQKTQMELEAKREEIAQTLMSKEQIEQAKIELGRLKVSVEVGLAQIKAQTEAFKATQDVKAAAAGQQHAEALESERQDFGLRHESDMAHTAHVHDRAMADHEVANRPKEQPSA